MVGMMIRVGGFVSEMFGVGAIDYGLRIHIVSNINKRLLQQLFHSSDFQVAEKVPKVVTVNVSAG